MHRYQLFGRVLETERSFGRRLIECGGPPNLLLRIESWPSSGTKVRGRTIFASDVAEGMPEPWLEAFATESGHFLRFTGLGCFDIRQSRITWCQASDSNLPLDAKSEGERSAEMEILFLGTVAAFWLEQCGAVCLHGSAVASRFKGIGFLGFNRAGKTTLATEFLASGEDLITDDLLVVERSSAGGFVAQPSYPQIRLWPTGVAHFIGDSADLPRVHSRLDKRRIEIASAGLGRLAVAATPLRALLLPERSAETERIELQRLTPREATIELLRHSFLGSLGEAAIGADQRFERLVEIAKQVPIFRLSYPDGLEHLPGVREAIRVRLATL